MGNTGWLSRNDGGYLVVRVHVFEFRGRGSQVTSKGRVETSNEVSGYDFEIGECCFRDKKSELGNVLFDSVLHLEYGQLIQCVSFR